MTAHVELIYPTHTYTATVREVRQLVEYLRTEEVKPKIGKVRIKTDCTIESARNSKDLKAFVRGYPHVTLRS